MIIKDILVNLLVAVVCSTATWLWNQRRNRARARAEAELLAGHAALLNGFDENSIFVFPHRNDELALWIEAMVKCLQKADVEFDDAAEEKFRKAVRSAKLPIDPNRIIPRGAVEDFLAINNIISAFLKAGLKPPSRIRDASSGKLSHSEKLHNSLILICSSRSNEVTREMLEKLRNNLPADQKHLIPIFEDADANRGPEFTHRYQIKWKGATWTSDSYAQWDRGEKELDDVAVIVKANHPSSAQHKILIVAGCRGFGTWGAAEALKKWWQAIHEQKASVPGKKLTKQGNFVAMFRVTYQDYDIAKVTLSDLEDLGG